MERRKKKFSAVLKLCKQWKKPIVGVVHKQSHDNHASTRTVITEFAKLVVKVVISYSISCQ